MSNNYGPIHLSPDTDEVTISRKRFNALCDTAAERDAALAEAAAHKAEAERLLDALNAALGIGGEFPLRQEGDPPYYWRTWLCAKAGLRYDGERYALAATPTAKEAK